MVKLFSLKSPDEWATTKQACRDTYVVTCFLPSTIRILALLYVLSTDFKFKPLIAEIRYFTPSWWGFIHRESLAGHLHRMDNPTQLLYSELCLSMRNQGPLGKGSKMLLREI